jgi:spore coat polysaccharide biosynthesis protein SpsF
MEIRGSRVYLRPMSTADTDLILRWRNDPYVASQLFSERPPTREEHNQFLDNLRARSDRQEFVIVLNEGDIAVGTIGLSQIDGTRGDAEYGILLGEADARGRGVAREASELILQHAFQALGLRRVVLHVFADNAAAITLYDHLGFHADPAHGKTKMKDGIARQVVRMVIERSEAMKPLDAGESRRRVIAVIQARMTSTRLPGKVLADIEGRPMLERVVDRTRQASRLSGLLVATSTGASDDPVESWCHAANVPVYRGSEHDVLDRYYRAASGAGADIVVRITADCPVSDPTVIDRVIQEFLDGDTDYASNTIERSYPHGLDVEVFSIQALTRAWDEAALTSEREHVTPYIWKNPDKFKLRSVVYEQDLSTLRVTVDESEDLEVIRHIYRRFGGGRFSFPELVDFLRGHPEITKLNARFKTNEGYEKSLREDRLVGRAQQ